MGYVQRDERPGALFGTAQGELGADGRYVHAQNLTAGIHPAHGCEGLVLDLDDLWREVGRAENADPS